MIQSPLLEHCQGYIAGRWHAQGEAARLPVRNPVDGSVLAEIPAMGAQEVKAASAAARAALEQPPPLQLRRQWLRRIVELLQQHKQELGRILTLEHGKPWREAQVEVEYAAGFFAYCAEHIELLEPYRLQERPKGLQWTVHHRPAGVVGLITPWNFPIGMIAKKLSAALAAGCACLIKPSAKTPLTMIALFHLLERLDLPAGQVNLLLGPSGGIGDALCADPHVAMLSFTGSTPVGRQLIERTAGQVKRLALELGGNAPFIVFADADLAHAADQLMSNKFRGGGQTCVCANRVYVQREVAEAFTDRVVERVAKLRLGDGLDPDTDLGPLIDRDGYEKVRRHLEDALDQGARRVFGDDVKPLRQDWGAFFPPTVLRGVRQGMLATCEETFGPLVSIIEFDDEAQAIEWSNDTEFGLAAYFFTCDAERAERIIPRLQFAHVGHNTGQGPTPEAPFGGIKQSGFGREGGREGLFEFVEAQTVPQAEPER